MKAVNVDDVLKILHKYGKYIFVTDEKRYSSMVDEIANLKALTQEPRWIPVSERLPNEDEIYYDGVGENNQCSDRVLAIDASGWIRVGYFIPSGKKNNYNGKRIRNKYSDYNSAGWEFGNNHKDKKENWIVSDSDYIPIAWMPLPDPYKAESEEEE